MKFTLIKVIDNKAVALRVVQGSDWTPAQAVAEALRLVPPVGGGTGATAVAVYEGSNPPQCFVINLRGQFSRWAA
ncbi:hypothetical protein D621_05650 [beta proteobacterium AAP51]|nr:hypothetical protein D621_05650 [beta proteobacterium AAP51]